MKIWILQTGEPCFLDKGNWRGMRGQNLSEVASEMGHSVIWWTSRFFHQKKEFRKGKRETIISDRVKVRMISSSGYLKNVSLRRIIDHWSMAVDLALELARTREVDRPDIVFIGYPPIEVAFTMHIYARTSGIPVVLDVKDLWPISLLEVVPKKARCLVRLVLSPYMMMARYIASRSKLITSMSLEYGERFGKALNIDLSSRLEAYPLVGKDMLGKEDCIDREKAICFVGSLTRSFSFEELGKAMLRLEQEGSDIKLIIAGSGDKSEEVQTIFAQRKNVEFRGWVMAKEVSEIMRKSIGCVMPYRVGGNFDGNLPNKVADCMREGLPVITTLRGTAERMIKEIGCGISVEDNEGYWIEAIKRLRNNDEEVELMGTNGMNYYKENLNFFKVYGDLVHRMERIVHERGEQ